MTVGHGGACPPPGPRVPTCALLQLPVLDLHRLLKDHVLLGQLGRAPRQVTARLRPQRGATHGHKGAWARGTGK